MSVINKLSVNSEHIFFTNIFYNTTLLNMHLKYDCLTCFVLLNQVLNVAPHTSAGLLSSDEYWSFKLNFNFKPYILALLINIIFHQQLGLQDIQICVCDYGPISFFIMKLHNWRNKSCDNYCANRAEFLAQSSGLRNIHYTTFARTHIHTTQISAIFPPSLSSKTLPQPAFIHDS